MSLDLWISWLWVIIDIITGNWGDLAASDTTGTTLELIRLVIFYMKRQCMSTRGLQKQNRAYLVSISSWSDGLGYKSKQL